MTANGAKGVIANTDIMKLPFHESPHHNPIPLNAAQKSVRSGIC
jgi:hypothetical protein